MRRSYALIAALVAFIGFSSHSMAMGSGPHPTVLYGIPPAVRGSSVVVPVNQAPTANELFFGAIPFLLFEGFLMATFLVIKKK